MPLPHAQRAISLGSGPGGQAINKSRSRVSLLHKPTGIRITCQETRSLSQNRELARRMLLERVKFHVSVCSRMHINARVTQLDQAENPGLSKRDIRILLERRRKQNREKKARKKRRIPEEVSSQY